MSSPIQLSEPGGRVATIEQPFEMMQACHQRLHRMLALLDKLRAHLPVHGADDQARQAARDIMKYFDQAAPQHHLDEEVHVFPPLLARGDAATAEVVCRLQQDHLQMESGWARARAVLDAIAQGQLQALAPSQAADVDAFAALYQSHIEAEEGVAYPAAQALLDEATVRAMGQEMAARRNAR
jgi:hemerythrin-like domain-containing protein